MLLRRGARLALLCAVAGEGQLHFLHCCGPGGQTLPPVTGHLSLTHSRICQMKGGARSPKNLCGPGAPALPSRGSAVRAEIDAEPTLPSAATGEEQDQRFHAQDPEASFS